MIYRTWWISREKKNKERKNKNIRILTNFVFFLPKQMFWNCDRMKTPSFTQLKPITFYLENNFYFSYPKLESKMRFSGFPAAHSGSNYIHGTCSENYSQQLIQRAKLVRLNQYVNSSTFYNYYYTERRDELNWCFILCTFIRFSGIVSQLKCCVPGREKEIANSYYFQMARTSDINIINHGSVSFVE